MIDYIPLTVTAGAKQTTAELRTLATGRMRDLGYPYVATEFSPNASGCRFDVIGLGRYTRQVRIYEIKASRADFLRDGKWENYLRYCTHFSIVCAAGVVQRWELPREVGLIEYGNPAFEKMLANRRFGFRMQPQDALRTARPARRLPSHVADDAWIAILERMAFTAAVAAEPPLFADGSGI